MSEDRILISEDSLLAKRVEILKAENDLLIAAGRLESQDQGAADNEEDFLRLAKELPEDYWTRPMLANIDPVKALTSEDGYYPTTTVSKLRGMTLWIMEILRDGGLLASWQIAEQTMKSCRYVNVYLNNLRKYGIASKYDDFWLLTDSGECLTSLLCRDRDRDRYKTRTKQQQNNNKTSVPKRRFQVSIQSWLRETSPSDAERVVVDMLVDHYNRTGSLYVYVPDHYALADMLKMNVEDILAAFPKLKQDHVAYPFHDPTLGQWKIALFKEFVEKLSLEREVSGESHG